MINYLFLAFAIIGEVIATSALKASNGFTVLIPSVLVVVFYALSFFFLALTLKVIPVGIAYATWSGAGIVIISLIGLVFFGQKLDLAAVVGIGFIIVGVAIVNLVSSSSH